MSHDCGREGATMNAALDDVDAPIWPSIDDCRYYMVVDSAHCGRVGHQSQRQQQL